MMAVRSSSERLNCAAPFFAAGDFIKWAPPGRNASEHHSRPSQSNLKSPTGHARSARARLLSLWNDIHRTANTHVVAGRVERPHNLIRSAGLPPAVAVCAAANDAARFGVGLQAERSWVRPHVALPLPNIAGHVLASI